MARRILLVEDDPGLALTISDLLTAEGYEVEVAPDDDIALVRGLTRAFDALVLDLMLPGRNGFEICQDLRSKGVDSAILMLTARSQITDRVVGLKLGADDYLTKPFDPAELLARLEALLRRMRKDNRPPVDAFSFGVVEVDFQRSEVRRNGQPVNLAVKEWLLLRYLIDHRERVIPRQELLQKVWQYAGDVSSRTVDTHVAWLRQKLEEHPQTPVHIQTIRGKGYRFSV